MSPPHRQVMAAGAALVAWVLAAAPPFAEATFNRCVANQEAFDRMMDERDHTGEVLQIDSAPTFFNGKKLVGDRSIDAFVTEIEPYLKDR